MPAHAVQMQPEHLRARELHAARAQSNDSDESDGALTPPKPRALPPVPSPRAAPAADRLEAENAMLKAALENARTTINEAAAERDDLRKRATEEISAMRASLDAERAELREASYTKAALLRRSEPHADLAEALRSLEAMKAGAAARDARDAAAKSALADEVSALKASGRAAARLQADLAAAHSELEAERQGRAAQTGAFRAQLDEIRAAKEEACRDAVDWAEESSRFKGEVGLQASVRFNSGRLVLLEFLTLREQRRDLALEPG